MKVSIVIPTLTLSLLKKCIASIVAHTYTEDLEIIVVANGAESAMWDYVNDLSDKGLPINLLWYPDALGSVPALNVGIKEAKGEFVLLLNDDCEILPSPKNKWLDDLLEPFSDPKIMVTGPFRMIPILGDAGVISLSPEDANYGFIVFFMALIRRKAFDELGLLDGQLRCGVDIDFCMKLKRKGYLIQQVPKDERLQYADPKHLTGSFPIWHAGEGTVHDFYGLDKWKEIIKKDAEVLERRYGTKGKKKTSIIIPTFGDSLDVLKRGIDSVIAHTNLSDNVEIIIVANGCPVSVREYVESLEGFSRLLVWFDQPIGFCSAINEGVKASLGEIVVLLNHDAVLLGNEWLNMLLEPFSRPEVGITGPVVGECSLIDRDFAMFFCAAVKKEVFEQIGMLDTIYNPGGLDDVDFCVRAEDAGWKVVRVPEQEAVQYGPEGFSGSFPIYHMENHTDWLSNTVLQKNSKILVDRYGKKEVVNKPIIEVNRAIAQMRILAFIPTRKRYFTTLPLIIESVILQTVKPNRLMIYDDNVSEERLDLRENELYRNLFGLLDAKGIEWQVVFGEGKGQHKGHQLSNRSGYDYVWRLDDDQIASPNVLEKLVSQMKPDVGAVAGTIITGAGSGQEGSSRLIDIYDMPNLQWSPGSGVVEVDHLYSSFLYRAGITDYCLDLSPVAHREETIFTYELKLKGYKLLVDRSAITHHLRQDTGGIRSHDSAWFYEHDEKLFTKKMEKWGYRLVLLNSGIGDHFTFKGILPELKAKYPNLIAAVCFPEIFENDGIKLTSIAQGEQWSHENVYVWMDERNWKKPLADAYREMYLGKE